jgi:hypothetical protein
MDNLNGVAVNSTTSKITNIVNKKRKIPKIGKKKDAPEVPIFLKVCL